MEIFFKKWKKKIMKCTKGMEIYTNMISGICFKNIRRLVFPSLSPHSYRES